MKNYTILNSKQVKRIIKVLEQQFGFGGKLDYVFLRTNKGKIYVVNRDIDRIDLDMVRINSMGLYFGELLDSGELRLSIEGSQIIGPKASKNVFELDDDSLRLWFKGIDFELEDDRNAFVIIKHDEDYCGCGKIKNKKLLNYVGKVRRANLIG